jgi:hypothetical protein
VLEELRGRQVVASCFFILTAGWTGGWSGGCRSGIIFTSSARIWQPLAAAARNHQTLTANCCQTLHKNQIIIIIFSRKTHPKKIAKKFAYLKIIWYLCIVRNNNH